MRLLSLCLVLAACSSEGDGSSPPVDGATTTPPVTPQVGGWEYDEVTPVSSTCPGNIQQGGTGNFAIDQASSASFHVIPADGTPSFTCTLNGSAFDCPDRLTNTQDLRPAVDAIVTARAVARGTFASATRATGMQDATITCAGTQCAAAGATFPCTVKVSFAIRAR